MKSVLLRHGTGGTVESFELSKNRLLVGRTQGDIRLPHDSVSRRHAMLESRSDGWLLTDLESRNGTSVNGVTVVRRVLQDSDRVCFGAMALTFRAFDDEQDWQGDVAVVELHPRPPGAMDADDSDALTRALPCETPFMDGAGDRNALAVLRHFAQPGVARAEIALQCILDDLLGIRGVRRVIVHVAASGAGDPALWLRKGASHCRPEVSFSKARMLQVVQEGCAAAVRAGREADPHSDCDAVCLPIPDSGTAVGCLYIEGEQLVSVAIMNAIRSVAVGIGIGLGIWRKAAREVEKTPRHHISSSATFGLVGRSRGLQTAMRMALRAAQSAATVLIRGESGTGKELFARMIYDESSRRKAPFIAVHCSAIEDSLLGSALFGHEKGAFTGAIGLKKGLFEEADGGTIFLDEIGELSSEMQVKLLRVLQEGEFMRVGGTRPIRVDVRVVTATNRDLEVALREGAFREDLYYRLKVIQIELPPLRERRDDIPDLARHFVSQIAKTLSTRVARVSDDAMRILQCYDWPGNIRELRNIIERSLVLAEGDVLEADDLPEELCDHGASTGSAEEPGRASLNDLERGHIRRVLDACAGNKRLAARKLGISRSTLYEKLRTTGEKTHAV